jgi:hypothetical protein
VNTNIGTEINGFARVRATNSTATSFTAPTATTTEPTADGVVSVPGRTGGRRVGPSNVLLMPFGTGSDNTTFDVRVIGWRLAGGSLWVPKILCQFTATLSAFVGVSGSDQVSNSERVADTVSDPVTGTGVVGTTCQPGSPANDTPADYLVDARGVQKLEVQFDLTGATAANCLYAWL